MSQPKILDWDLIARLAQLQCTEVEIAFACKCNWKALLKYCKQTQGCSFKDFLNNHKEDGRVSLRRLQWESAQKGNITMQIWLGKQWLGQADKQEITETKRPEPRPTFVFLMADGTKVTPRELAVGSSYSHSQN